MPIRVRDFVIYTPVDNVIQVLRNELLVDYGVVRFATGKMTNGNYMTNCPFHSDGQERKPSFGISEDGECHCFACGYSAKSFEQFLNNLFDKPDNDDFAVTWVSRHLSVIEQETRKVHLDFGRTRKLQSSVPPANIISEEQLDSYRYIHPYMYERGLTDEIIEKFDIGYDREHRCITFPVKELDGTVSAVLTRSVVSKFFTIPEGYEKPVYGAYLFTTGKYKSAYICESMFNALTCWVYNVPAVALIGTGSSHQIDILRKLPVRSYTLALDPDEAGQKATNRIARALRGYKLLSKLVYKKGDYRDINDLQSEFLSLNTVLI